MNRIIIYHDDADGRCAAAIAGRHIRDSRPEKVSYYPIWHGDPVPWEAFDGFGIDEDELWILDFSFDPDTMEKMKVLVGEKFIWIDHHFTELQKLQDLSFSPKGLRDIGYAGCYLTWIFCHGSESSMPLAVQYIADRDIWKFRLGDNTRYFYEAYLAEEDRQPYASVWDQWLYQRPKNVVRELATGRGLHQHRIRGLAAWAKRLGRETRVFGTDLSCLKMNYPGSGDMGQVVRDLGYDICWCYVEEIKGGNKVRTHSIYSKVFDCGTYAKMRGKPKRGGGHKGAAGWTEVL